MIYFPCMKEDLIKTLIRDFHLGEYPQYFSRLIHIPLDTNKIISLIGPRRSGKTSVCFNVMRELVNRGVDRNNILYINFEDERLTFTTEELSLIITAYQTLYPDIDLKTCYFFFDEIQNIEGWDKFVRRIYDTTTKNIIITGSNAKLLSKEIATSLRGRTLSYEILPFSFKEYCIYQNIEIDLFSSKQQAVIKNKLSEYLIYGGFPEIIQQIDAIKIKILQEYFNVMMYRDMIERYEIKNIALLKYFLKRLYTSATKNISVNNIYNELKSAGQKISKDNLYEYLEISDNIYLIKVLKKYVPKLVHQELGEKKVYTIDNGLLNSMSFKFSEDIGKCMEQVVFQELLRRYEEVYFYKESNECDFVIKQGLDITKAIQVCYDLNDHQTQSREFSGLIAACKTFNLKQGLLISANMKEQRIINDIVIEVVPLYEWLLS